MIKLISPENNECVSLLTEKQKSFFKDEPASAAIVDYDGFRWYAPEMAGVDMTAPAPVKLSWDDDVPGDGAYLVFLPIKAHIRYTSTALPELAERGLSR